MQVEASEVNEAIDHHKEIVVWEKNLSAAVWIIYFVALAVWIFTDSVKAFPLFLMALALLIARIAVGRVEVRRRRAAIKLVSAFKREKVRPFYVELCEKFADQPHIIIGLSDDGSINIEDRSNNKGEKK